jgi:hypothetical protein
MCQSAAEAILRMREPRPIQIPRHLRALEGVRWEAVVALNGLLRRNLHLSGAVAMQTGGGGGGGGGGGWPGAGAAGGGRGVTAMEVDLTNEPDEDE